MQEAQQGVNVPFQDLVKMMAKDIAGAIIADLKKSTIEPLEARVEQLELKQNTSTTQVRTALDVVWRLAVIAAGLISIITKIDPNFFHR